MKISSTSTPAVPFLSVISRFSWNWTCVGEFNLDSIHLLFKLQVDRKKAGRRKVEGLNGNPLKGESKQNNISIWNAISSRSISSDNSSRREPSNPLHHARSRLFAPSLRCKVNSPNTAAILLINAHSTSRPKANIIANRFSAYSIIDSRGQGRNKLRGLKGDWNCCCWSKDAGQKDGVAETPPSSSLTTFPLALLISGGGGGSSKEDHVLLPPF